jgi:hypothetical protein
MVWAWRSSGLGAPATPADFYLFSTAFRSTIQPVPSIVGPWVGGSFYTIQHVREPCMDAPATGTKSGNPQPVQHAVQHEDRNTWIFTCYAICGIVAFGVLAYYAALYFAS